MAGSYWYGAAAKQVAEPPPVVTAKRRLSEFDNAGSRNLSSFCMREDRRGETHVVDTDPMGAHRNFYLQCSQMSPFLGGESSTSADGWLDEHPVDVSVRGSYPERRNESPSMALDGGKPKSSFPSDYSRTLYVQGLPSDCTCREVSHLFRPFVGYEEVRLIRKEPRHPGGDPALFCFVDFKSPAHAATAKDALQGYKFDELDPHSVCLRLQFARYPGARSSGERQYPSTRSGGERQYPSTRSGGERQYPSARSGGERHYPAARSGGGRR